MADVVATLEAIVDGLLVKRDEIAKTKADKRKPLDELMEKLKSEKRDPTDEEKLSFDKWEAEVREVDASIKTLDAELEQRSDELKREQRAAELRRRTPSGIIVTDESLTYQRGNGRSYLKDLVDSARPDGRKQDAIERLARHGAEMRLNMSRTDGTGGEFVPPLWVIDQYVKLARAGRVVADLCNKLPLPPGTDSINLPKVATGGAAAEQADSGVVQKTDITTTSVSGAVTTIAGQQVFAMQLLDQSPINFDEVVFQDLLADLAKQVDVYVISKAAIGILNVTGINAITYTDASPTVPELYPKLADGVQQIHTGRFMPPQAIAMHPRRWGWILASLDSSNRPLVVPNAQGPLNAFAGMTDVRSEGSVGTLQGLPVYVDANVPINLGAGTNEDRIIEARFDDLYLYEGETRTRALFETDGNTLEVRLQVWEYLAFIGDRYPAAVSVVSGTGLITPTF